MRILFITDRIPFPPVSGNLLRTYHLCKRLAQQHELWLVAPLNQGEDRAGVHHMRQLCHTVVTAPRRKMGALHHVPGLIKYALQGNPLEYKFEHCEELFQLVRQHTAAVDFDVVHIEPSYMGLYQEAIASSTRTRRSLTFHNIESHLFRELALVERPAKRRLRAQLHSLMLRRWEARYTERFDQLITVSESDRHLLLKANPRLKVTVMPNGVDTCELQPLPMAGVTPSLIFVGSMSYSACVDAMLFFRQEILPRIRREIENVELWIVGRDPAPEIEALQGDGVYVTGAVEDVQPYYRQSTVCVVPLRAGGGTRLKILEAMALGRPVVSTSKGCEGLDVVDGEHLAIADDPEEFAQKTIQLLKDSALHSKISRQARRLVEDRYSWDVIATQLSDFYVAQLNPDPAKHALSRLVEGSTP
jgi:polysaccharide biosynthesis protein PslH